MKKVLEEKWQIFVITLKQTINTCLNTIKQTNSCIKYYDFNSLYGWALLQSRSCGRLELVKDLSLIISEFILK